MSGSPGNQDGWRGNSRPNKKRKFRESGDDRRQRLRGGYDLIERPEAANARGAPRHPPGDEVQLHRLAPGMVRLDACEGASGFKMEDVSGGYVNWIGAFSKYNHLAWGSRVSLNSPEAMAALRVSMEAIGAQRNASTVRLAMIFEPATGTDNNDTISTAGAHKVQNAPGPASNPFGAPAPTVSSFGFPSFNVGQFSTAGPGVVVKRETEAHHSAAPASQWDFATPTPAYERRLEKKSRIPDKVKLGALDPPVKPEEGFATAAVAVNRETKDSRLPEPAVKQESQESSFLDAASAVEFEMEKRA